MPYSHLSKILSHHVRKRLRSWRDDCPAQKASARFQSMVSSSHRCGSWQRSKAWCRVRGLGGYRIFGSRGQPDLMHP